MTEVLNRTIANQCVEPNVINTWFSFLISDNRQMLEQHILLETKW